MADTKSSVWIALIGAAASIGVAFITTKGTISSASPEIEQATAQIQQLERDFEKTRQAVISFGEIERVASMPIGSVVSSLLPPAQFSETVGDPSVFDPKVSRWVFADSISDITLSAYGRLMNVSRAPDLRGVFLRGIDTGRADKNGDLELNRQPGSFQSDDFRQHSHSVTEMVHNDAIDGVDSATTHSFEHRNESKQSGTAGGGETRPKNAAVYFYLKIN